jgi:hypothetical protein
MQLRFFFGKVKIVNNQERCLQLEVSLFFCIEKVYEIVVSTRSLC